jgi:hypothetical protein
MQMFYGRQVVNLGLGGKNFDRGLLLCDCFSQTSYPIFAAGCADVGRLVCVLGLCLYHRGLKLLKLFWFV